MGDEREDVYVSPGNRLSQIAERLRAGEPQPAIITRKFLSWFGAYRRGYWIVKRIRGELGRAELITEPDFESAYIDGPITFALAPKAVELSGTVSPTGSVTTDIVLVQPQAATVTIGIADPTYRIGKLFAANQSPVSVAPDNPIQTAITLMLTNDYSQLPVMTNERTVRGMVSWRSVGARWALNRDGVAVRDFMEEAPEIVADRSLFSAIPVIVEYGYILVRDATNRVSGIVTTSDLSLQFQQMAEPFLLLGEIENHVRRLMDGKFTRDDLNQARDPSDTERHIESVADLTFGEYIRLLQEPTMWAKLRIDIDRATFTRELDAVRLIRNDVMHFDSDAVPDPDLLTLRRFARFLQTLQSLGV